MLTGLRNTDSDYPFDIFKLFFAYCVGTNICRIITEHVEFSLLFIGYIHNKNVDIQFSAISVIIFIMYAHSQGLS